MDRPPTKDDERVVRCTPTNGNIGSPFKTV
jgi:hypothetical protein